MGRFTYYSPLWLGLLLTLALNSLVREAAPPQSETRFWLLVTAIGVGVGLVCQLGLIGAQGAFGQVLPVPRGRSLRGRPASVSGWLLLLAIALGASAGLLWIEKGLQAVRVIIAVLAGLALAAALIVYAWNLPAAVSDFREEQ